MQLRKQWRFNFPTKISSTILLSKKQKKFMKQKKIASIKLLETLIQRFPNFDKYPFIGLGSKEEHLGFSEGKPLLWHKQRYGVNDLSAEDLLNHALMETPNYDGSIEWYNKMSGKHPQNYKILYGSALNNENKNNIRSAYLDYTRVIELNPEFSKAYCNTAYLLADPQQSLRLANICLAKDPSNVYAKRFLALNSKEQQRIQRLQQILKQEAQYSRVLRQIGDHYFFNNCQYELAIQKYEACVKMNPLFFSPKISICDAYLSLRNPTKALQNLEKLLSEDLRSEQKSEVLQVIGISYDAKKELKQSIAYFKQSIEADPSRITAIKKLATLYQQNKKQQFAVKNYQKVLRRNEGQIESLRGITRCYTKLNKFTEAITYYKKWISVEPQNVAIKFQLGSTYFRLKDWRSSLDYFLICKAESYNLKPTYSTIIDNYYKLADYDNALKYIEQSLQQEQLSREQYDKILQYTNRIRKAQDASKHGHN